MSKVVILVLVVLVVLGLMAASKRRLTRRDKPSTPKIADMQPCAHCGVHVPAAEALWRDGLPYCGEAHRALGPPRA